MPYLREYYQAIEKNIINLNRNHWGDKNIKDRTVGLKCDNRCTYIYCVRNRRSPGSIHCLIEASNKNNTERPEPNNDPTYVQKCDTGPTTNRSLGDLGRNKGYPRVSRVLGHGTTPYALPI